MKKVGLVSMFFLLSIISLLVGCNSKLENSSNSLEITKTDEKIILDYLDTKTNDIDVARKGKMYSAFTILGTDEDKIYVWLLKEEYIKEDDEIVQQNGTALPVVLYINNGKNGIEIKNHKYPEDGEKYGSSMKKLFPNNIIYVISHNDNERATKLHEIIKNRAEKDYNNSIGYGNKEYSVNIKNTDNISIYYGASSYAMFGANESTIKTLSDCFNNLNFESTDKQMDILSMFSICFFYGEKQIAKVSVDKNGVFWLNGNTECLKISSGKFNYNDIKDIYEEDKNSIRGTRVEDFEKLGITIQLPKNKNWIGNPTYSIIDETVAQVKYYDKLVETDMTLRAGKMDVQTLFGIRCSFDDKREENWLARTAGGKNINVKLQYVISDKEEKKVFVSWNYKEFNYILWGNISNKGVDASPIAKTALSILNKMK